MQKWRTLTFVIILLAVGLHCNRNGAYKTPYLVSVGIVLDKEVCKINPNQDYWLINMDDPFLPGDVRFGDTLVFQGVKYNHVLKTLDLVAEHKIPQLRLYFTGIASTQPFVDTDCTQSPAIVFELKTIHLYGQADMP